MSEQAGAPTGGFQFNGPTVVGLLYLATYFTAFSAVVGVILAYVWRRQPVPEWQQSQFGYLIRTFWLGLGGYAVAGAGAVGAIAGFGSDTHVPPAVLVAALVIGVGGFLVLTVLLLVRCAFVIVNAQQCVPMAKPHSWTV